jgi:hypothetical protein
VRNYARIADLSDNLQGDSSNSAKATALRMFRGPVGNRTGGHMDEQRKQESGGKSAYVTQ